MKGSVLLFVAFTLMGCPLSTAWAKGGQKSDKCLQKQIPYLLKLARTTPLRAQPRLLLMGLYQRCPKMPLALRALLSQHFKIPSYVRSRIWPKPTGPVLKVKPRYWRRACPKFPLKSFARLDSLAPFEQAQYIHKRCGGVGATLMTKAEAKRSEMYHFVGGAAFYVGLVASGVPAKVAREYTRRGFMMRYIHKKWSLQPSRSRFAFRPATEVELLQTMVLVNSKKVCSVRKGKIAAAHRGKGAVSLIRPLHARLIEAANRIRRISRFNRSIKFKGRMVLFVRPEMRYQLVQDALYTSAKAGYRLWSFVTQNPTFPSTSLHLLSFRIIDYKPGTTPVVGKGPVAIVRWTKAGISIRVGKQDVALGCGKKGLVSQMKGKASVPFGKQFQQRLRACAHRVRGWFPKVKAVILVPTLWSDFRALVVGLDAFSFSTKGRGLFPATYLAVQAW